MTVSLNIFTIDVFGCGPGPTCPPCGCNGCGTCYDCLSDGCHSKVCGPCSGCDPRANACISSCVSPCGACRSISVFPYYWCEPTCPENKYSCSYGPYSEQCNCCDSMCEYCSAESGCKPDEVKEVYSFKYGGCIYIFTVDTLPISKAYSATWSSDGTPSTGEGEIYTTIFNSCGPHTVTATLCDSCKSKQIEIACPVNFHETYRVVRSDGTLYFEYQWDSSTGNKNDLDGCLIGEKVDYPGGNPYFWPSPWLDSSRNPVDLNIAATSETMADTHYPGTWTSPLISSSFSASQIYRHKCCEGEYTTLMGPQSIDREILHDSGCIMYWRYRIQKTGLVGTWCIEP